MTPFGLVPLLLAAGLAGQVKPPAGGGVGPERRSGVTSHSLVSTPGELPRVVVTAVAATSAGGGAQPGGALPSEALGAALERGLAAGGLDVIAHRRVDAVLLRHPHLRNCRTPACRARLGQILDARLCAEVSLRGDAPNLEVTVSILACVTGAPQSIQTRRCRAGTPEQVAEAVVRLAESTAAEAGRVASRAPARHSSGDGVSGMPSGERRRARVSSAMLWSGLSLVGAGLVAVAVGGTLWGLDGRVFDRGVVLDRVYQTRAGGIAATSVGIGALLGGVTLAVLAWKRAASPGTSESHATPPAALRVTLDPARRLVGLSGSF